MSKKRVVTTFEKLSEELQNLVKEIYSSKGSSALIKLEMYSEPTYALVIETNEISYLVKISKKLKAYFDKVLLKYNPNAETDEDQEVDNKDDLDIDISFNEFNSLDNDLDASGANFSI